MLYHPKENIICYDSPDLKALFEAPMRAWILEEVIKRKIEDVLRDIDKMLQLVAEWKGFKDKEEIEIFSALYLFPQFYPKGTQICFKLKDGIDPRKTPIESLDKLKIFLKENDLTDFLLRVDDGFRAFQLKAYKGKTTSKELFAFLKKKLDRYGNNMGDINFLIMLQSEGDIPENFFKEIHEALLTLPLKGGGHILISYNENNKLDVMNTVYPTLGTTTVPYEYFA